MTKDEATQYLEKLGKARSAPAEVGYADPVAEFHRLLNAMPMNQNGRFVTKFILEEHNTLQQDAMRDIILPIIKGMAALKATGRGDARNQGSLDLAEAMLAGIGDEPYYLPRI